VHRHQKDQEISGGATVEAEQQHVALLPVSFPPELFEIQASR